MQQAYVIDSLTSVKSWILPLLKTVAGSLFIALCAQISIPLPFTPVPLTFQTLAILFLGITLGSKQAAYCTILYLIEILSGLPFLAGGISNPLAFIGPRAGYLFAMPILAYIAGMTSATKSVGYNLIILGFASIIMLGMGTIGLANFVGWKYAFFMGFYPFLAGEALKVLIVTFYLNKRSN